MPNLSEEAAFELFMLTASDSEYKDISGRILAKQLDSGEAPALLQEYERQLLELVESYDG